jgi:uncharacterized protein YecT (DUF1311 family)
LNYAQINPAISLDGREDAMKGFVWAPVLALCLAAAPPSARAFDCSKAYMPVDFVICSDPAVIRANDAHERAWYDARARLTDVEKQDLLADQRRWLKDYPPRCGVPAQGGRPPAITRDQQGCVAKALEERAAFLEHYRGQATQTQSSPQAAPRKRENQTAGSVDQPGRVSGIEQIDFKNFTFPLSAPEKDCAGLDRHTISLKQGKARYKDPQFDSGVEISLMKVTYANLTGNPVNEAVVSIDCSPFAGNYSDALTFIFTLQSEKPILLGSLGNTNTERDYRKFYPNGYVFPVGGAEIGAGRLIVFRQADGAHACPLNDVRFEYVWNGGAFVLAGKPLKRKNPNC